MPTKKVQYLWYQTIAFLMVQSMRLELTRLYKHYPLKVARLPIPPPLQLFVEIWKTLSSCPEQDSNLHVREDTSTWN